MVTLPSSKRMSSAASRNPPRFGLRLAASSLKAVSGSLDRLGAGFAGSTEGGSGCGAGRGGGGAARGAGSGAALRGGIVAIVAGADAGRGAGAAGLDAGAGAAPGCQVP